MANKGPETTVIQDLGAHGLSMQWARSIRAAVDLLNSAREKTVIVTELARGDGDWRDIIQRVIGPVIPEPNEMLVFDQI